MSAWPRCSSETTRRRTSTSTPSIVQRTTHDIETRDHRLPADTSEEDVLRLVAEINDDPAVDGLLVQLPLPPHMDEVKVTHAVAPIKDVDGFHPVNAGNLYLGTPLHVPATAAGCLELLRAYDVPITGREAVVIGRSEIVGRPTAMLLLQESATVTMCHSRTADLAGHVRRGRHRRGRRRRPGARQAGLGQARSGAASTSASPAPTTGSAEMSTARVPTSRAT